MNAFRNGAVYENNYQRAAAFYLSTCALPPENAQERAAYDLITGVYQAIFDHAAALNFKTAPDVSFTPWEQQRDRQKDVKLIREPIAKIEALIAALFDLIESGKEPDGALKKKLAVAGVVFPLPEDAKEGLRRLCEISRASAVPITDGKVTEKPYLHFSRAVFDPHSDWLIARFDDLLDARGALVRLAQALTERGYKRVLCFDGKKPSLDYVKPHGKNPGMLKQAWAERDHSGVGVTYEELRLEPCFIWLRAPQYKTVLEKIDTFPAAARDFLLSHTKNCDGCRYCVQTDKTGTRPLAAIGGKCPLYPGFGFNWRRLTDEFKDNLIAALDAIDGALE